MISDPRKFVSDALARERDERVQERRRGEADARTLLEAAAGEMVEDQAREPFRHLNRDFGNGRPIAGRFSPAFGGHYVDVLLSDLAAFNDWTGRIWRGVEDEALQAVGQILDNGALLRGAGSSYPTMLMYLRDQRRWAVWGPITDQLHRGLLHLGRDRLLARSRCGSKGAQLRPLLPLQPRSFSVGVDRRLHGWRPPEVRLLTERFSRV